MWLVDLHAGATPTVEAVPCPVPRPLETITGRLEDLLADPAHEAVREAWLRVILTDAQRPINAMERLRSRFPHTAHLDFVPEGGTDTTATSYTERTRHRTDAEIAREFISHVRGGREPDPAEAALLQRAVEEARVDGTAKETI
jgi:exonuclease SbcD